MIGMKFHSRWIHLRTLVWSISVLREPFCYRTPGERREAKIGAVFRHPLEGVPP